MPLDSETFDLLLGTVRRFVQERLIPRETEVAENNAIPADILAEMRQLGLYGLAIPEAFGGLELNMEEEVRVVFELGQASPAFRSAIGTNIGIGSQGIVLAGTDEQEKKISAQIGFRRTRRFVRAERAGRRLRRHGHPDSCRQGWRLIRYHREQALYHHCAGSGTVHAHGADVQFP